MSVFEIIMLACFGAAWPFSIYKSAKSGSNNGKSVAFLAIVLAGYGAGVTHKILCNCDLVTYLYALNGLMVLADICVYWHNAVRT